MKTTKILYIVVFACMMFPSCKSPGFVPQDPIPYIMERADSEIVRQIRINYDTLVVRVTQVQATSDTTKARQKTQAKILSEMEQADLQAKFQQEGTRIAGKLKDHERKIDETKTLLSRIDQFLSPAHRQHLLDSIAKAEIKAMHITKRKLTAEEMQQVNTRVNNRFNKIVNNHLSRMLQVSETLINLYRDQQTIIFEHQKLNENKRLSEYLMHINNESFFASGADTLTSFAQLQLKDRIKKYVAEINFRVPIILMLLPPDTVPGQLHKFTLELHVTGFTDNQGFSDKGRDYYKNFIPGGVLPVDTTERRRLLNQVLSQKRAEHIAEIFKEVFNTEFAINNPNVQLQPLKPDPVGKGEDCCPDPRWKDIKDIPNEYRRITLLQCTFELE